MGFAFRLLFRGLWVDFVSGVVKKMLWFFRLKGKFQILIVSCDISRLDLFEHAKCNLKMYFFICKNPF